MLYLDSSWGLLQYRMAKAIQWQITWLKHWTGLLEKDEAVVFDTTASNAGVRQGCVFLFEKIVQRAVLWLACQHHTSELFIKNANIEVRGPTTGPEDVLFKLFKKKFNLIDTTHLEGWIWPANTDWRHQRAEDVLEWADLHMSQGTWPREDYREMVELTVSWFIFNLIFPINFKLYLRSSSTSILQRPLSIFNHPNPKQPCRVLVRWVYQIVWSANHWYIWWYYLCHYQLCM